MERLKERLSAHFDDIDWEYCERRAKEEDCQQMLAKMKAWADEHRQDFYIDTDE